MISVHFINLIMEFNPPAQQKAPYARLANPEE
jgi:hypothetical protein